MASDFAKVLAQTTDRDVLHAVPCTITSASPLTVTILGATGIPGLGLVGATYATGPAVAFLRPGTTPLILRFA